MGLEIATVHTADPAEARMVVEIATAEKMATVLMVKAHMMVEIATALMEAHI
jgi:poly-gamma-glutamate capsule biosynthesis protein CapA/YwtB (metallophosphatase superfamily)